MGLLNTKITIYLPVVLVNSSQIKKTLRIINSKQPRIEDMICKAKYIISLILLKHK